MADVRDVSADTLFDAAGSEIKGQADIEAARLAGVGTATACLELHGTGQGGSVVFTIQLMVNPNTYPFLVLGGFIGGDICNTPATLWKVTSGSFGPTLLIQAKRGPPVNTPNAPLVVGSSCALTMTAVGFFQAPDSYAGTYGFNGSSSDFSHTTLFKGWQPCA
jgi:hypothetical protein